MTPREREKYQADLVRNALEEFESQLVSYTTAILHDVDRARDVVQETFIKLWHQEPDKVGENLKSWLYRVCRNAALDVLRKERRMVDGAEATLDSLASSAPDPAEVQALAEDHAQVVRFMERLSPNQREVIRLKFEHDLSYKEISEITDLSVTNVGFLIHTGLRRLRELLSHKELS